MIIATHDYLHYCSYVYDISDVSLVDSKNNDDEYDKIILLQVEYESSLMVIDKLFVKVGRLIVAYKDK